MYVYVLDTQVVDYHYASFTAKMSDGLVLSYSHPKVKSQQSSNIATTLNTTINGYNILSDSEIIYFDFCTYNNHKYLVI